MISASCLCGAAAFDLPDNPGPITACHCRQCRKTSGHFSASFGVAESSVIWRRRGSVAEYRTKAGSTRGFCRNCGFSLWFRGPNKGFSVEAGAVDGATGTTLESHIFMADKGDYYAISDRLPQFAGPGDD